MFLSQLRLNPRQRQVQRDLGSPYEMHRTLWRAFGDRRDRVLYRVDAEDGQSPPVVLVQSAEEPDWTAVDDGNGYLIDAASKEISLALRAGQPLRFRLRANPTVYRDGRRLAIQTPDDQLAWLDRQLGKAGAQTLSATVTRSFRQTTRPGPNPQIHQVADYDGVLRVAEPDRLISAVDSGIGRAKAYGCGLVVLARA